MKATLFHGNDSGYITALMLIFLFGLFIFVEAYYVYVKVFTETSTKNEKEFLEEKAIIKVRVNNETD